MNTEKKKVLFRGPVLSMSGYGEHCRQVARWLFQQEDERDDIELNFEPLPWGTTTWITDVHAYGGLVGRVLQSSKREDPYDVSFQLQLPNEWDPFIAEYNVGITAGVETDTCPSEWIQNINSMDMIIVPSEHVKKTFENTGDVNTPIHVVPESYQPEFGNGYSNEPLELEGLNTDFNFLMISQFTGNNPENDRKNIAYTIKWLYEEFGDEEDVGIILKTNFGKNTTQDRIQAANVISKLVMDIGGKQVPRLYLVHGLMSEKDMARLYQHPKVKAYLNLSRGEGFSIPTLEASVSGLPVIVTNWSGHLDYLNKGKFIKVDYTLAPIHESKVDGQLFKEGMQWAHPDEKDAKRKLKRFYQDPTVPQNWANELKDTLLETHSQESIQKQYTNLLKGIL